MPLTEWESLSHCVAMFAATPLVKDAQPQSLLLVGPPGQGKSSTVKRFARMPFAKGASAVSVSGLKKLLSIDSSMRLLVLDEFQRLFSMTKDSVQNVCGLLLSLLSGDGSLELVGPQNGRENYMDLKNRQLAVLASIPDKVLMSRLNDIEATGLLSRFCLLSVIRSDEEAKRVQHNIIWAHKQGKKPEDVCGDLTSYPNPPRMPKRQMRVSLTAEACRELEAWAPDTFPKSDDRKLVMAVTLVRTIALMNGRNLATVNDVKQLRAFSPYLTSLTYEGALSPNHIPPLTKLPSWVE